MSVAAMPLPMMAAAANWITAFAMAATNSHHFDLTLDYPWGNTLYRLEEQYPAAAAATVTVTVGVCYVYIFSIPNLHKHEHNAARWTESSSSLGSCSTSSSCL